MRRRRVRDTAASVMAYCSGYLLLFGSLMVMRNLRTVHGFSVPSSSSSCSVLSQLSSTVTPSLSRPTSAATRVWISEESESEPEVDTNNAPTEEKKENHAFSKTKWRKKRYNMMKDVDDRIQRGDPKAVRKAQEMIQRMRHLYEITQHEEYKPTAQAYNLWINALAKSGQGGKEAELVIKEMHEHGVAPNAVSYTSVIDAHARGKSKNAAKEAERVLFELIEEQQKLGGMAATSDPNSDLSVSSVTCDAVLNAWARQSTPEAAERAQLILERMEEFQNKQIRPTVHSYSTVMNAYAKCKTGEAAERAEQMLDRLLQKAKSGGGAIKPDTVIFNTVIHAWASSGDPRAGTQAVSLLNRMQDLHATKKYDTAPDTVTFNSVLSAWSHSGHIHAAQQAERILQQMQHLAAEAPEVAPKPNTVSYNSVLHAYSKSPQPEAAQRARAVLDYMIRSENPDIFPDVYSFTSVLNAIAKSKDPEKAGQAQDLLETMLTTQKKLKPSVVPYNAVLNAAAFSAQNTSSDQQKAALQIAVSTFTKLRQHPRLKPDTISYGNLLKCCANLVPQGKTRNEMALQIFTKCCEDGMVGDLAWNEVRRAVPPRLLSGILSRQGIEKSLGSVQVRDLPRGWRQHVNDKKTQTSSRRRRKSRSKSDKSSDVTSTPMRPLRAMVEPSYESGKDL